MKKKKIFENNKYIEKNIARRMPVNFDSDMISSMADLIDFVRFGAVVVVVVVHCVVELEFQLYRN